MATIAIDIGTTKSCIYVFREGKAEIIPNTITNNDRLTPSYIAFSEHETLFGRVGRKKIPYKDQYHVFNVKALIEEVDASDEFTENFATNGSESIHTPLKAISLYLKELRRYAQAFLGTTISDLVFTIPISYKRAQQQLVLKACANAGFKNTTLLDESIAAAIAFTKPRDYVGTRSLMVFDFGGGNINVSVLNQEKNSFVIKAQKHVKIGGNQLDENLKNSLIDQIKSNDNRKLFELLNYCRQAKEELSEEPISVLKLSELGASSDVEISRLEFDGLNENVFDKCVQAIDECLRKFNLKDQDIDDVIVLGGCAHIHMVKQVLQKYSKKILKADIDPREAVAAGAAIYASMLQQGEQINWQTSLLQVSKGGLVRQFSKAIKKPLQDVLAIDLKTENTCVAILQNGKPTVLLHSNNRTTIPAYVSFEGGNVLTGVQARRGMIHNPENTIHDFVSMLGLNYADIGLHKRMKFWKFKLADDNDCVKICINDSLSTLKYYSPEDICTKFLKRLKDSAESQISRSITSAVLTIPTDLTEEQRVSLVKCAKSVGFDNVGLLNEPVAASVAYSSSGMQTKERKVLVCDLKDYSFDLSLIVYTVKTIAMTNVTRNEKLGIHLIDFNVFVYLRQEIIRKYEFDVNSNHDKFLQFVRIYETSIPSLLANKTVTLQLRDIVEFHKDPVIELTMEVYNDVNGDTLKDSIKCVDTFLETSNIRCSDVDEVILMGGIAKVPKFVELMEDYFKKALKYTFNGYHVVAVGAAIAGSRWTGSITSQCEICFKL